MVSCKGGQVVNTTMVLGLQVGVREMNSCGGFGGIGEDVDRLTPFYYKRGGLVLVLGQGEVEWAGLVHGLE